MMMVDYCLNLSCSKIAKTLYNKDEFFLCSLSLPKKFTSEVKFF